MYVKKVRFLTFSGVYISSPMVYCSSVVAVGKTLTLH